MILTIQTSDPLPTPLDQASQNCLKKTQADQFAEFLDDASRMNQGFAEAVYFPKTALQAANILQEAHAKKKTITMAGNHTGLVGGAIPQGGWVMATHFFSQSFPKINETIVDIISGIDELTAIPFQFYIKRENDHLSAVTPPGSRKREIWRRNTRPSQVNSVSPRRSRLSGKVVISRPTRVAMSRAVVR